MFLLVGQHFQQLADGLQFFRQHFGALADFKITRHKRVNRFVFGMFPIEVGRVEQAVIQENIAFGQELLSTNPCSVRPAELDFAFASQRLRQMPGIFDDFYRLRFKFRQLYRLRMVCDRASNSIGSLFCISI